MVWKSPWIGKYHAYYERSIGRDILKCEDTNIIPCVIQ